MTPEEKAREITFDVKNEFGLRLEQAMRIERLVIEALREARADGMRKAARVIEDYGLRFWQEQDLPLSPDAMLQSLAHLIKRHSGELNDSKA